MQEISYLALGLVNDFLYSIVKDHFSAGLSEGQYCLQDFQIQHCLTSIILPNHLGTLRTFSNFKGFVVGQVIR